MDPVSSADVFLFERFRFDRRSGGLFDMDGTQVAVGSRALDVLGVLIERAGELVSKDEIMDVVWPGTTVEEANLTVQISALRRVLDNRGSERSTIQTVAGRGYRFVAAITRHNEASSFDSKALPQHGSRVPPRLSIVVLPIINLSRDPEQEYFADALTDSLTTDLSRLAGSFVISCNTAFTYKGRKVSARQIGSEVGVRYVLEGSVQRSGKQVRINAQLIDAETDGHVWAERFERETGDLFALQEEITRRIAVTLNIALVGAEAARPTEHPVALDYILRGRAATMTPASRENRTEAIGLFEQALALDPRSVAAQSYLATALSARILDHLTDTAAADIERATGLAGQALAASPRPAARSRITPTARCCGRRIGTPRRLAIRDGNRVRSQLGARLRPYRLVQALHGADRGGDPARRASHPPESPRPRNRHLVHADRSGASPAIALRRGGYLARKGA